MRSRRLVRVLGTVLLLGIAPGAANGQVLTWRGGIEAESRAFPHGPLGDAQTQHDVSGALQGELSISWDRGRQLITFEPFVRLDAIDGRRTHFDLRVLSYERAWRNIELRIGIRRVFWGVTESRHLVDVINQTDLVENPDGEDKLGQPMINVALQRDWGLLSLYVMPYFRERTFPGIDGRLRPALPIDTDRPVYESSDGRNHVDIALRYSHYFGDIDIGLNVFRGTSREARFTLAPGGTALLPNYDQVTQFGVDLQYTHEAWLWKLETIVREGYSHTFAAAVGGFEYTLFQVRDSAADLGLLLEYQYDGRNESEPLTIADNDVFVGTRLALNDTQDTSLLAGIAYDVDSGETFVNIEAERRFGEDWVLEMRARGFSGADPNDITYSFVSDDYVQLQISKFF